MSDSTEVTISFTASVDITVKHEDLNAKKYDLQDSYELKEAIEDWVDKNATPEVCYTDYSGKQSYIIIRDMNCSFEMGGVTRIQQA